MRKLVLIVLLFIGALRVLGVLHNPLDDKKVRLSGMLITEPKEYENSLLVRLHDYTFFVPWNDSISYNSYIVVEGQVHEYDLNSVQVITVTAPQTLLSKLRARILSSIRSSLPEPMSSLVGGAVLGAPNIPHDFSERLNKTGTSHIVVASGGNLAILAGFLESILARFMKRKLFLPLVAIVLIIYSALTGFGSPIVRALIMWGVIMCAQLTGRVVNPVSALLMTVIVMLIYKPLWALDVSFYLSVGSTAAILLFSAKIRMVLSRIKILTWIREAIATSLAAQIGVLPVSLVVFSEANLLSPLWNALVLWTVPYITIIGIVGALVSLLIEPISKVIFFMTYPFCWYFVKVISWT